MIAFQYHPDILARFPTVVGGVILARGLTGGPTTDALRDEFLAEQQATLGRIGTTPLSQIESLAAWRRAFSAFGVAPTQYRGAAEALLRRLTKQGDIPGVNRLVDIGNLVSIRHALPIAVVDRRAATGTITVRFAAGDERFTNLGAAEAEHPEPGEVIFADDTGLVVARRWCWRQSAESAARDDTTEAIVTIEGHHATARADIEAAQRDMVDLLARYAGGAFTAGILDATTPGI